MSPVPLQKPILDAQYGGIRSVNFFNGRLLSAEDLNKEATALQEARRRLGRAIGEGVAFGLEVSPTRGVDTKKDPRVTITQGLAINRRGNTLALSADVDLSLARSQSNGNGSTSASADFGDCHPLELGPYLLGGVYLLTIGPASGSEGRAPVSGLGNAAASCNTAYNIESIQFRKIELPLKPDVLTDRDHLQNRLAYACFGTGSENMSDLLLAPFGTNIPNVSTFLSDPFGTQLESYGLLDALRPNYLTDCEVPLAVVYWTVDNGIEFVDMWSVRRRLTKAATEQSWSPLLSDRRASEAEAMFLQFEDQLETSQSIFTTPATVMATQYFRYLPSVGFLPQAGAARNFSYTVFFDQLTIRNPIYIDDARVEALIRSGLVYAPIDLSTKELIRLYWVRENRGSSYLIFTSGYVPFQEEARFDLSHWDYSYIA